MSKSRFFYLVKVICLSFIFSLLFWHFTPNQHKSLSYTSPLPDFLTVSHNTQVKLLDFWQPLLSFMTADAKAPELTAHAALVYDLTTNKTLYEKNPHERMPMASLTKIMTAIMALENPKEDDRYIVRPSSIVGEDSMGLTAGEILPQKELLYGLLLNSGNDAAEVIADNYPGGRENFLQAMNKRAEAMGLSDTHYSNPSGLQGDGIQYTTAYDLLVITEYAITHFPEFTEITSTYEHMVPATASNNAHYLQNETNLLTTYPGVKGVKTGYTPEAGLCLVTYLEYDGHKIIGVVLNSENRREEMRDLLDYSLEELGITPPAHG